jgi:hypothetical protein
MPDYESLPPSPWAAPSWQPQAAVPIQPPPVPAFAAVPQMYELRPLSTGEILDRTFSIYRRRFWLFAGLAVVASSVTTVGEFVRLTWGLGPMQAANLSGARPSAAVSQNFLIFELVSLSVTLLVYFIAYSLTQAATVSAVFSVYLGRETSIGIAFGHIRQHWLRYILISLWQGWSYVWLPLLLFTLAIASIAVAAFGARFGIAGSIVGGILALLGCLSFLYGIYAYMRNSLAIAAAVVEDLKVRAAMRRSKVLTKGRILRVLALLLLLFVLGMAAGVAQMIPATLFTLLLKNLTLRIVLEGLTLLTTFVTGALLAPVGAIAFCLFYIDERVRREGFDIETLLERGHTPSAAPAPGMAPSPFSGKLA